MVNYSRRDPPSRFVRVMHGMVGALVGACLGLVFASGTGHIVLIIATLSGVCFGLSYALGDRGFSWLAELVWWTP